MRDRLIELIHNAEIKYLSHGIQMVENAMNEDLICPIENKQNFIANYLLANGVIVPPCKVGDTVYCIIKGFSGVMRGHVCSFILTDKKTTIHCAIDGYFGQDFPYCEFGKTVFLTKEEAEQALSKSVTDTNVGDKLKGGEG